MRSNANVAGNRSGGSGAPVRSQVLGTFLESCESLSLGLVHVGQCHHNCCSPRTTLRCWLVSSWASSLQEIELY